MKIVRKLYKTWRMGGYKREIKRQKAVGMECKMLRYEL
jgi:hypothetical protein